MAAEKSMVCSCGCGHGGHWTYFLLRTLLMILILMVVFWCGLEVGRMSGGYDRYDMMRGYPYPVGVYSGAGGVGMPMMRVNGATSSPTTGGVQNY